MTPGLEDAAISGDGPPAEEVGQGRYVIVGSLGAGSQGETLEAVDKREGRPVAVKRFALRSAKSWKDVELAEREATVLASLSHPSLPRYIEHFEENGALYLVMEKIEGESLAARRRRKAPLDHEQVLRFLRDAAASLAYLHGHAPPIVHRDIKPGNVILRPDGSYCLVDFGSVRDSLKPEGGSTVVGTFGFMAPEQFQGRAAPISDVYAVGATAIGLLSGREPEDLPHKGLGIDVEAALRGQVDRRLLNAIRSMLEPDPDRRARSVAQALEAAGLDVDVDAARSGSSAEAAKRARKARIEAEARYSSQPRDQAHDRHAERDARRQTKRALRDAERQTKQALRDAERQTKQAVSDADRQTKRAVHQALKNAHREARRARHRGQWRPPGRPVPPGMVLGMVIMLALRVASVATFALFQFLLPLLFTFIPVAGRRQRMLQIGQAGQRGLQTAREHIRYQFLGGPTPESVQSFIDTSATTGAPEPAAPGRQRISVDALADHIEAEAEAFEAELEELETKHARR